MLGGITREEVVEDGVEEVDFQRRMAEELLLH